MTVQQKIDLIKSLDDAGIASRNEVAISHLKNVYERLKGISFSEGCGNCVRKAYGALQLMLINEEIMENSNFKLKEGALLPIGEFGTAEFLSNDNMTDNKAYAVLSREPKLIGYFEEYPKNEAGELLPKNENLPAKTKNVVVTSLDGLNAKNVSSDNSAIVHPITDKEALRAFFKLKTNSLDKLKADYSAKFNREVPENLITKADIYNAIYSLVEEPQY